MPTAPSAQHTQAHTATHTLAMLKTVYEWVRWFSGRAGGKLESLRGKFSCLNETTNATKAECNSHLKLKVATAATRAATATTTKRFVVKTETFFASATSKRQGGDGGKWP